MDSREIVAASADRRCPKVSARSAPVSTDQCEATRLRSRADHTTTVAGRRMAYHTFKTQQNRSRHPPWCPKSKWQKWISVLTAVFRVRADALGFRSLCAEEEARTCRHLHFAGIELVGVGRYMGIRLSCTTSLRLQETLSVLSAVRRGLQRSGRPAVAAADAHWQ